MLDMSQNGQCEIYKELWETLCSWKNERLDWGAKEMKSPEQQMGRP